MEPITTAAAITAAAGAIGGGANAYATGKQNKKSRAFSREMYQTQKADNIAFWNMQNEYNTPEAQMERLKKAGLNPNMVYDKGGAIQPAGNISTPDVQSAQFRTPDFGAIGTNIVQGYFDTRIKQAQYDNLKAQNTETINRSLNIAADTAYKVKQTDGQDTANKLSRLTLFPMAEAAWLENQKKIADTNFTNDANFRAAAMQAPNMEQALVNIARSKLGMELDKTQMNKMEQEIRNLASTNAFQNIQNEMARNGVMPGDNVFMRMAAEYLEGLLGKSEYYIGKKAEGRRDQKSLYDLLNWDPSSAIRDYMYDKAWKMYKNW
jgi:hypothetical protein